MERRIYQVTPKDELKAADKALDAAARLSKIEADKAAGKNFRSRQTTYGLAKRDATRRLLLGDVEYYEGRGQGMIDRMMELPYTEERRSPAYNMGYHEGYAFSEGEMYQYIANNPNFAGLHRANKMEVEL